jgi:UrcA family protein
MFNRTLSALAAVALTGATLAASTPATARTEDQASVRYADLNLASPDGAQRLGQRIRQAAVQVCGTFSNDLRLNEAVGECQSRAIAGAKAEAQVALAGMTGGSGTVALLAN